ncbi:pectate lyase family protein [Virgisporangium aliadipatigenens]|nr:RICIN domain-containing protein [Virgisporangium aliadipatigenens]
MDTSTPRRLRLRRGWRTGLVGAAVLTLVGAGTAFVLNPAEAATIDTGAYYQFVNVNSGLAVEGNTSTVLQQPVNGSSTTQQFQFLDMGSGYYRLKSRSSGRVVEVAGGSTADGATVQMAAGGGSSAYQQQFQVLDSATDVVRFRNRSSGKVLDAWEWSTAAGSRISQFGDLNGANQQFRLVKVGGGTTPTSGPTGNPGTPQTGLVGWATQNGGTTGGGSAATTTVTSASALTSALASTSPAVIRVSGNISCSGMLRVRSHKTILGNSGATITGCGFNINGDSNVIIRNLNFTGWDDDAINVQESAKNIWIDHNSFSNGYDGAVDIKRGSDFVTVSWNRVFNHDKSMLLGHSDDNAAQDTGHLRVTYHHNYFDGTTQRHPRVRFGNPVHVYNNYYRANSGYGVASTEGAGVLVEGNYFENVADPFHLGEGDSGPGTLVARNNTLVGSGSGQTGGSVASIPYSYTLDASANVKAGVTAGAGAGRISV